MKFLTDIRAWLKGKKTYLVCIGAIIAVAVAWGDGNVTDFQAADGLVKAIFGMTIRAAIGKVFE
ncbi:MAG: hypothetical protein KAX78_11845 [Phycisphaerae bacterium]|nr:hypothetical protein [Phycisphaerae bacterium]